MSRWTACRPQEAHRQNPVRDMFGMKNILLLLWLKLGLIVGVSSLVISYVVILLLPMFSR